MLFFRLYYSISMRPFGRASAHIILHIDFILLQIPSDILYILIQNELKILKSLNYRFAYKWKV